MTKEIFDCKIFEDYDDKEYVIKTEHKIFGTNEMKSVINGFIDEEDRVGIITHGKELYCYRKNENFNVVWKNNMIIISDNMMKIFICS